MRREWQHCIQSHWQRWYWIKHETRKTTTTNNTDAQSNCHDRWYEWKGKQHKHNHQTRECKKSCTGNIHYVLNLLIPMRKDRTWMAARKAEKMPRFEHTVWMRSTCACQKETLVIATVYKLFEYSHIFLNSLLLLLLLIVDYSIVSNTWW